MGCVVVGGGVVGLAVARRLARRGTVFLVERQRWLAQDQSSRNSEAPRVGSPGNVSRHFSYLFSTLEVRSKPSPRVARWCTPGSTTRRGR